MSAHEKAVEAVAIAISGAPFPTKRSKAKADAAISAYLSSLKESGFVVVPREPTEDMLIAGGSAAIIAIDVEDSINDLVKSVHAELCDASPFVEQEGNHDRT